MSLSGEESLKKILLDFKNSDFEATVVSADSNYSIKNNWKRFTDFLKYLKEKILMSVEKMGNITSS